MINKERYSYHQPSELLNTQMSTQLPKQSSVPLPTQLPVQPPAPVQTQMTELPPEAVPTQLPVQPPAQTPTAMPVPQKPQPAQIQTDSSFSQRQPMVQIPPMPAPITVAPPPDPNAPTKASLKRDINKLSLVYAGSMIAMLVAVSIVVFFYTSITVFFDANFLELIKTDAEVLPEATNDYLDAKFGGSSFSTVMIVGQIICLAVATSFYFILRGKKLLTSDIRTKRETPKFSFILAMICCMFAVQFVMTVFNILTMPITEAADVSLTEDMNEAMQIFTLNPIGILYVVLLGPIMEEIIFRGAILRHLERYGANFAIVISSLLFGLYHLIFFQAIFAFLIGLLLAYVAGRFSLKWSLLLHIINNAFSEATLLSSDLLGPVLTGLITMLLYLGGFIIALVYLLINHKLLVQQKRVGAPPKTVFRSFSVAFRRPLFVALIAIMFLFCTGVPNLVMSSFSDIIFRLGGSG
ncbi:MAG: CPBP family intramembrane metalloprotease [Coriobacteriales bacterium]|jgi:membrane protease YdiL (CAAX protease family)|nr:CPBP family intramembrane metalloprotease [Coriobacteriales bacterium]